MFVGRPAPLHIPRYMEQVRAIYLERRVPYLSPDMRLQPARQRQFLLSGSGRDWRCAPRARDVQVLAAPGTVDMTSPAAHMSAPREIGTAAARYGVLTWLKRTSANSLRRTALTSPPSLLRNIVATGALLPPGTIGPACDGQAIRSGGNRRGSSGCT